MQVPSIHLLLCGPRGFCAGVSRAIAIVEAALEKFGAPVYVRHEIVHNKDVVARLVAKGAIFVEELGEIPVTDRPVIFSAHGVSDSVVEEARARGFMVVDATCPLVSKVHHRAKVAEGQGAHIVMIGHKGHPEVLGTMGQVAAGGATLVESVEQAETVELPQGPLSLVTQTTLSVDETKATIEMLLRRFPEMKMPKSEDICFATTNRQAAVKAVAPRVDVMIVVGAPNSSNSRQLATVAREQGAKAVMMVQRAEELDETAFVQALPQGGVVGLTSGASVPEDLVQDVVTWLRNHTPSLTQEDVVVAEEAAVFKLPPILAA
jgi:4-hydroxy-3-methylbut-2-enyl diphosphate reductase